jgi:hypothetical protein
MFVVGNGVIVTISVLKFSVVYCEVEIGGIFLPIGEPCMNEIVLISATSVICSMVQSFEKLVFIFWLRNLLHFMDIEI